MVDIAKDSPAEKAVLRIGDIILTAQGAWVDNPDAFGYRLMTAGIGKRFKLGILRHGRQFDTDAVL